MFKERFIDIKIYYSIGKTDFSLLISAHKTEKLTFTKQ